LRQVEEYVRVGWRRSAWAALSAFDVTIIGADGATQTMFGFQSEADAKAWIVPDKALTDRGDC
jgi:hypothetical protein